MGTPGIAGALKTTPVSSAKRPSIRRMRRWQTKTEEKKLRARTMQVDAKNYLVPIDAKLAAQSDLTSRPRS
jgi:hypothetical protein